MTEKPKETKLEDLLEPCSEEELKTRTMFKKDFKLSCPVLDDNEIFQKALKIAKLESEWEDYYELAYHHPNLDEFRRNLVSEIITKIKSMPEYKLVQNVDKSEYKQYPTSHTYLSDQNVGKNLISIDLISGNYQSLKYFGDNLVLGTDNYSDFIKQFTKEPSLIRSKYFRQLVFGLLKPRVFITVQKYMIAHIIDALFKKREFPIVNLTNDEVVFESGKTSQEVEADKEFIRQTLAEAQIPYQFRVDDFNIEKIPNFYNEPWYVKYSELQGRRIMGVHLKYLYQVYNHMEKIPNQPKDFWWRERGRLCCLLDAEKFDPPPTQTQTQTQKQS